MLDTVSGIRLGGQLKLGGNGGGSGSFGRGKQWRGAPKEIRLPLGRGLDVAPEEKPALGWPDSSVDQSVVLMHMARMQVGSQVRPLSRINQ